MQTSIIDTHVHFWNPDVLRYDWLATSPSLNRRLLPSDFDNATVGIDIDQMVFVECDCHPSLSIQEVEWIEELAKVDQRIKSIVAHVDLTNERGIDAHLEEITSHGSVSGIRHNIQFNKPGFALQKSFVSGVKKVLELNKHFELCITHDQMEECIELMSRLPASPVVLDHCGKPGIRDGEIDRWKTNIERLSGFDQLYCKVSGLLTEADHLHWTMDEITPYMDHVLACFGIDRIMYGSDWPVCTLAGGYLKWYEVVSKWTKAWDADEVRRFYHDNAMQFYRL